MPPKFAYKLKFYDICKNFCQKMKVTPNVIASLVNGVVEGDGEIEIKGFAKIEEAGEGDISFIANPKYQHFAEITKASALIVSNDFESNGKSIPVLIRVSDPYSTLAILMTRFAPSEKTPEGIESPAHISEGVTYGENCYIGAFSYIGKNVKIGNNVKIYPQCYIGDGAVVEDDTVIRPHVSVYEGCKIGKRCVIHSGAVVGSDGFGFAPSEGRYNKIPQIGIVVIEDDVEIGANTTIDRATLGETRIGRGTKLDNLIQVAHNVRLGEDNVIAAQTGVAGSTQIGNGNRIGGQVGFSGHIKFGNNCEVGAQSGIPKGYGDNARIIGYPAVDARSFAKGKIYVERIPELQQEIKKLKEEINKLKK